MTAGILAETRDEIWSRVLHRIEADALDCLQANLAACAEEVDPGRHLRLGAHWGCAIRDVDGGSGAGADAGQPQNMRLATVEPTLADRLAQARELLGVRVVNRAAGLTGPALRDWVTTADVAYVVGDAYRMPWVPYFGQQHIEHSFLLARRNTGYLIIDAYHNDTPWGAARPSVWRLGAAGLDSAVEGGVEAFTFAIEPVAAVSPVTALTDNREALVAAAPVLADYLARFRAVPDPVMVLDRLTLDVWLLTRARLLHARWLRQVAGNPAAAELVETHGRSWQELATHVYVAMRRARRGRADPAPVISRLTHLLQEDLTLAERLATDALTVAADTSDSRRRTASVPRHVRAAVEESLCSVLGVDVAALTGAGSLRDVPTFTSFRLVSVVERVEQRLSVEVDPADLTPESLQDLDRLCQLFARTVARAEGEPRP